MRTTNEADNSTGTASRLIETSRSIARQIDALEFGPPVAMVYNPLIYAAPSYEQYLSRFADGPKRVLLLGMNPGPWGMAQTGVPFGEIASVAEWMGIRAEVGTPDREHPKRPVEGFDCTKSEVSGRRLWGLMQERFGSADRFFAEHFVANYCPLAFLEESGRNRTPDRLPVAEREALFNYCDTLLTETLDALDPEWLVGVGKFATERLSNVAGDTGRVVSLLHPSPANPRANRGWSDAATKQLVDSGVWVEQNL